MSDSAMKSLLLLWNFLLLCLVGYIYLYSLCVLVSNSFFWLQSVLLSRYAQEEEADDSHHDHRQSLDALSHERYCI
jgi:hypothetical protein